MLTSLVNAKAYGFLFEEGHSLHWFYPGKNRDGVSFGHVYPSNVSNGFTSPEDFYMLDSVLKVLNAKEQVILVMYEPSLGGAFPAVEKILAEGLQVKK